MKIHLKSRSFLNQDSIWGSNLSPPNIGVMNMKNILQNRIENEDIVRYVEKFGKPELLKILLREFKHEGEWAVYHRLAEIKNTPNLTDNLRKELREQWGGMNCPICMEYMHCDTSENCIVEIEHIIERALGGSNDLTNLFPCCNNCNRTLGNIFNEYVIQGMDKRMISQEQWVVLIKEWVVFKQLLYWERDLAFWLFENFHRQFKKHSNRKIQWENKYGNFDGLIHRAKIAKRIESVIKKLRECFHQEKFELEFGPPPKRIDMSAYARRYRIQLKNYLKKVTS